MLDLVEHNSVSPNISHNEINSKYDNLIRRETICGSKKFILLFALLFFSQIPAALADNIDDCPSVINFAKIAQLNTKR